MEFDEILESAARLTPQYLAGFFDGEGSVMIKSCDSRLIRLCVNLTNTDLRILALIGMRFPGGGPYEMNSPKTRKQCYQLCWSGKSARPILEFIKDHVIIKRERVLLGLRMAQLTGERGRDISEANKVEREEIAERVTKMNDSARNSSREVLR